MRSTWLFVRTSSLGWSAADRSAFNIAGPTGLPSFGAWKRSALAPPPRVIPLRSAPSDPIQSAAAADSLARISTRAGIPRFFPPLRVSLYMSSQLSLMPFSAWARVPAAFMPPDAIWVLPPVIGIFSSTITLAPRSCAVIAALKPAPPDPMTTMSVFVSCAEAASARPGLATTDAATSLRTSRRFIVASRPRSWRTTLRLRPRSACRSSCDSSGSRLSIPGDPCGRSCRGCCRDGRRGD